MKTVAVIGASSNRDKFGTGHGRDAACGGRYNAKRIGPPQARESCR